MPDREIYRDPNTGRFASKANVGFFQRLVHEIYTATGGKEVTEYTVTDYERETQQETVSHEQNWEVRDSRWGLAWVAYEGEMMDFDALQDAEFPWGMDEWRIRYVIAPGDPRYSRGYATSGPMGPMDWPPAMNVLQGVRPIGIAMIQFRD